MAILYLQQGDMRLGLSQLIKSQALRSDPDGDVEVVEAFWENERLGWSGCCVPLPPDRGLVRVIAAVQSGAEAEGEHNPTVEDLSHPAWQRGTLEDMESEDYESNQGSFRPKASI